MKEFKLAGEFGPQLADGELAYRYLSGSVEPGLQDGHDIILDFSGVRSANSSFVNALVATLIERRGPKILCHVTFRGCTPVVKVLVEAAIALGTRKHEGLLSA